jgi:hypothetical protein
MRFSLLIGIFLSTTALACGVCVEDKVAAVYDHAAVTHALGAGRTVVFFAIDGDIKPTQRLAIQKAASVRGVDAQSVRVSVELSSLALAFDPRRATLVQVQAEVERRLRPLGLSLLEMRLMDRPGDLAEIRTLAGQR